MAPLLSRTSDPPQNLRRGARVLRPAVRRAPPLRRKFLDSGQRTLRPAQSLRLVSLCRHSGRSLRLLRGVGTKASLPIASRRVPGSVMSRSVELRLGNPRREGPREGRCCPSQASARRLLINPGAVFSSSSRPKASTGWQLHCLDTGIPAECVQPPNASPEAGVRTIEAFRDPRMLSGLTAHDSVWAGDVLHSD